MTDTTTAWLSEKIERLEAELADLRQERDALQTALDYAVKTLWNRRTGRRPKPASDVPPNLSATDSFKPGAADE